MAAAAMARPIGEKTTPSTALMAGNMAAPKLLSAVIIMPPIGASTLIAKPPIELKAFMAMPAMGDKTLIIMPPNGPSMLIIILIKPDNNPLPPALPSGDSSCPAISLSSLSDAFP